MNRKIKLKYKIREKAKFPIIMLPIISFILSIALIKIYGCIWVFTAMTFIPMGLLLIWVFYDIFRIITSN